MSLLHRLRLKRLGITPRHKVTVQRKINVPTPDGAQLLTDLFLSSSAAKAPVVMIRSPYGRSSFAFHAYGLASQGYHVVLQSCRGTFGSGGVFDPHHDEKRDGLATIEWIKQQPWYGGAIATYGMSYLGYVQWAIAAAAGPELKAMAMQVTMSDFSQMTYCGDSFMLENAFSWTHMMNTMKKGGLKIVLQMLFGKLKPEQWKTLPLAAMDEKIAGERVNFWQDWLDHASSRDPWWSTMNFHPTIADISHPISMIAGWHDIFLPFQMRDYSALQNTGKNVRLTIGPWTHTTAEGGLPDAIDWFNQHLSNDGNSAVSAFEKPVKLYVMGADEWRYFDTWPPREMRIEPWYLQPQKQLHNRIASASPADNYRYDPADPTPSLGGPGLFGKECSVDNATLEARADVLTYTSAILNQPVDVIGPVTADLYVSSSANSADFFVRLCDVDEQGVSKNVCDGLQRVQMTAHDSPQHVRIEFWPTAYRFAAGHRLRVQVSSGAFPRWARNPGGTESIGAATELHVATQSIHHSPEYPSAINLPMVDAGN
ncbi:MAG: CocE/NonD family hydrolase [Spongiibacteraceae bacterium]